MAFADLRDGRRFHVKAFSKVKEPGRSKDGPTNIVHTSDGATFPKPELAELRVKCDFNEDDPRLEFVLLV